MRYLLAPDSFKESATALQVAQAMRRGILAADPTAETRLMPLSDGGEGLTVTLTHATGGTMREVTAHDALGQPIIARYGFLGDAATAADQRTDASSEYGASPRTAVIELAEASGLEAIPPTERRPLEASTLGTGEIMAAAIEAGAERIILGLGGSATTDGGTGLARALGYRFLDREGRELPPGGGDLIRLERIDDAHVNPLTRRIPVILASDVTNPLTGPTGAAQVFAPQKGATSMQVERLDAGLAHLADAIERFNGRRVHDRPGAGAAGGTGAGLLGLFEAQIMPGIELVLDMVHGRQACEWADLVITGEGSIDAQTPHGKVPAGIARLAHACGTPAIAVGGRVTRDPHVLAQLRQAGIKAAFPIAPGPAELEDLLRDVEINVETTCAAIAGLLN